MDIKENKTREKIKGTKVDMGKMENHEKSERISKRTKELGEIREANLKAKNMVEKVKLGVKPKDVINNTVKKEKETGREEGKNKWLKKKKREEIGRKKDVNGSQPKATKKENRKERRKKISGNY